MMPSTISTALPGKKANPEVFLMGGMIPGKAMAGCIYIPFFLRSRVFFGSFCCCLRYWKIRRKTENQKKLDIVENRCYIILKM